MDVNTTRRTHCLARTIGRCCSVLGLAGLLLSSASGCFPSGFPTPSFLRPETPKGPEKDSFILRADGDLVEEKASKAVSDVSQGELAAGREHFRTGDYARAEAVFMHIVDNEKSSPAIAQEAMYYLAEALRLQKNYPKAADAYVALLKKFPNSTYREQCVQHMFDIANYWLDETRAEMKEDRERREGKRWIVWPRLISFEQSHPLLDREGRAIQLLENVRMHDINGPLADQSLFWCGVVKMYNQDYREADYYLKQIHSRHPESPLAPQALELSIYCKHMSTGGADYDGRQTAEARKLIQAAMRSYPQIANDPKKRAFLEEQMKLINLQQAEKDYKIAEYFRRTGKAESAYFYYELVRRRYPQTKFARLAEERWNELRVTLEKDMGHAPASQPAPVPASPSTAQRMNPGQAIPSTNNQWSGGGTPKPAPATPATPPPAGLPSMLPTPTPAPSGSLSAPTPAPMP